MKDYLENTWQKLHALAEPSGEEKKTANFVIEELKSFGYEDILTNVNDTYGVIASYDSGEEGPVLGIRAELDALIYETDGEIEYRHTCGHDAHMAIVLGVAQEVMKNKPKKGRIRFIFQPAEETLSGAIQMVESGELDDLTHILGLHIRPIQDCAVGQATAAIYHSATAPTKITVHGLAAHASRPHLGNNAVEAAVEIVNALNAIKIDPTVSHSLKTTQINTAGKSTNVIPDHVEMSVDVRSQENDVLDEITKKIEEAAKYAAKANGCKADVDIKSTAAAEYDEEMIELNEKAIVEVLGEEGLIPKIINPGSDDFHNYGIQLGIKSGFVGLGANASPGLHDRNMSFDHDALEYGQKIIYKVVNYLTNY